MVNVEKQRTKALQSFKIKHINRMIANNLSFPRRDSDATIEEDIVIGGVRLGTFVFDRKTSKLTVVDNVLSNKGQARDSDGSAGNTAGNPDKV